MSASFVITNAQVYRTETRDFMNGSVVVKNGRIMEILPLEIEKSVDPLINADGCYLVPGLVDIHTHGRIHYDFDSATTEEMQRMRRSYAADGTTTLLPTVASAPMENIEHAIDRIKEVGFDGIHLEGRYLNIKRRGAHRTDLLAPLDTEELTRLLHRMEPLKTVHITCAPELDGGEVFVKTALAHGATVAIGHTDATFEQAEDARMWGATALTHTFNAMPPLHHRNPGVLAAGLNADDMYCEIIADGFHLAPAIVNLVYKMKRPEHLVLITDSMSATRCEDGDYSIAGQKVFVRDGKAVNEDGAIAGSTITLYSAVLHFMQYTGASFAEALAYATITPAKMVGLDTVTGSIAVGKRADLLLIEKDSLAIKCVYAAGQEIPCTYTPQ